MSTVHTREPAPGRPTSGPISAEDLGTWPAPDHQTVTIRTSELTAHCPVTGQPDFYTLEIRYRPDRLLVESKSLKHYLWGFRGQHIGDEDLAAQLRDALGGTLHPAALTVELHQNTRGGLEITATATVNGGVPRAGL